MPKFASSRSILARRFITRIEQLIDEIRLDADGSPPTCLREQPFDLPPIEMPPRCKRVGDRVERASVVAATRLGICMQAAQLVVDRLAQS